jgi:hypothetical protein
MSAGSVADWHLPRWGHRLAFRETVSILMYHGVAAAPLPFANWCFVNLYRPEREMRRVLERLFRCGYVPEWLTAFHDTDPPPMAARGLVAFDTVCSDYHTWGLYREPGESALLAAIFDLRCARHVLLRRSAGSEA